MGETNKRYWNNPGLAKAGSPYHHEAQRRKIKEWLLGPWKHASMDRATW